MRTETRRIDRTRLAASARRSSKGKQGAMRFTSRGSAQRETTTANSTHDAFGTVLPQKGETFFGGRTRLGRKKTVKKGVTQEVSGGLSHDQDRSLGSREEELDTEQALFDDDMAERRAKLNVWPNVERGNRSANDVRELYTYNSSSRSGVPPGIPPRRTSTNAVTNHYDPSKHPYYVTQQTSASAVRDMSLHKGSSLTIHETASDSMLKKRPLKSALKKNASPESSRRQPDKLLDVKTSSSEKKPRRLDLSQFLPRNNSRTHLSPNTLSPSPSALTDNSYFAPHETVHVQLKRPAANAPYTTHKTVKPPSVDSGSTTRAKVFEADIYDGAKTNVRRPPKGIQNWFDGFDISTDEESESEMKKPQQEPQELPADDLSSVYSPWHVRSDSEQPRLDRKASRDPVEDNLLAIKHAKERIQERMRLVGQRKGSVDTATIASVVSSEVPERKRGGSRLALLELASQSVLSLSDSSGDEKVGAKASRGNIDDASMIAVASIAPSEPLRKVSSKRSMASEHLPRQSTSTVQTSGSIPIRLTDSIPLPTRPPLPETKRATYTSYSDPTAQALRKLTGQATPQSSRSRRTTKTSAQDSETIGSVETPSSAPSDGSHLMAVSEEEMILLEMMRNKRAAMQSNSFAEGYQLALKREQELMMKRRESAQQTALNILRQREDKMNTQRNSRIGPLDEADNIDEQYRRKYSAIRKEEVDKALKLEKFLADMKTPTMDKFPEPPARIDTSDEGHRRPPQKFELLLPSIYSPSPSKMMDSSSPVSAEGSSPAPEFDDIEDHHHQVRQFLASSSASEVTGAFPTPPSAKSKPDSRREKHRSIISPSPVAEEEDIPDMPSVARHATGSKTRERRRSINGRGLSAHQLDFDPTIARASAMPAPLRQANQNQQPFYLTPNFDFSPLEFPTSQLSVSPSLSTSRASPLTPTFVTLPSSWKPTVEGASSSDNASYRGRAYTPDTDLASLSASASAPNSIAQSSTRKRGGATKKVPPKLDTIISNSMHERSDTASITSAGDDVLEAWASLGGASLPLASRRRAR
ncbi:hypothetical protein LTR27_009748 [Elasticomyces elasticus]|nr:hypothetical protein LTR27_009748 [Elasticomyces elasticus]